MLALASFVMRGPTHAGLVAVTGLLAALVVAHRVIEARGEPTATNLLAPPLFTPALWLAGAAVALYMLRKGTSEGLAAAAVPLLATIPLAWWLLGDPWHGPILVVSFWAPVLCVAALLRQTVRLELSLLAAGGFGIAMVLCIFVAVDDPTAFWSQSLYVADLTGQLKSWLGATVPESGSLDWQPLQDGIARLMTGVVGVGVLVNTVLSLLLARWWQAALFNPGGFAAEFHELRLGRAAAGCAALLLLGAALTEAALLTNIVWVVVALYLFQGLAVLHGAVKRRGLGRGWLVASYVIAFTMPQLMALLGIVDAWADIRARVPAAPR